MTKVSLSEYDNMVEAVPSDSRTPFGLITLMPEFMQYANALGSRHARLGHTARLLRNNPVHDLPHRISPQPDRSCWSRQHELHAPRLTQAASNTDEILRPRLHESSGEVPIALLTEVELPAPDRERG